jgi:hypothetical protein
MDKHKRRNGSSVQLSRKIRMKRGKELTVCGSRGRKEDW